MKSTINIASGDTPNALVKRQLGKTNIGLYCNSCAEFFAAIVLEDGQDPNQLEFKSDGPIAFQCPFCQTLQKRDVSEMGAVRITEGNKRRPLPPKDAH
jgi:hypothetical protein